MAPPFKRRRVARSMSDDTTSSVDHSLPFDSAASFSPALEHSPASDAFAHSPMLPQRVEELHIKIQTRALYPDGHSPVQRRQDTASSPSSSSSSSSTDSSSTSLSATVSASESASTTQLDLLTALSSVESILTGTDSGVSSSTSTGNDSSATSGSVTPSSFIASTSALLPQSSLSGNISTSALILISNGTTTTSKVTINLASVLPSSRTSHTSDDGLVFLATLSDGHVVSITRGSRPFVTTFEDGQVSTIEPTGSHSATSDAAHVTLTSLETTSIAPSTADRSTVTSVTMASGAGAGAAQETAASSTTSGAASANNSNASTPPAGTIAGGVVGGAAGLAVVLLVAMLFFRWYRRSAQHGHRALPSNTAMSPEPRDGPSMRSGPGMAERAGLMPLMGAVPTMFRHQSRGAHGSEPSERGFTRVAGRKLPSQFSDAIAGPTPNMPLSGEDRSHSSPSFYSDSPTPSMPLNRGDADLTNTSFYRDSTGFHGGEGESPISMSSGGAYRGIDQMTLSPGPQRRPTVHHGGPYALSSDEIPVPARSRHRPVALSTSPTGTFGTQATLDRSETPSTVDGNRSSRFTEEV